MMVIFYPQIKLISLSAQQVIHILATSRILAKVAFPVYLEDLLGCPGLNIGDGAHHSLHALA